jgi:hypothetical protein
MAYNQGAAWAEAKKYMGPEEIARIEKQLTKTPDGSVAWNPSAAQGVTGAPDILEIEKQFNQTAPDKQGDFFNQLANVNPMLQSALNSRLREVRGESAQKDWLTGTDNKQRSMVNSLQGLPAWMTGQGGPPGGMPPPKTGGGFSPFFSPTSRGGMPKGAMVTDPTGGDPTGGGGPVGGGPAQNPMAQVLTRIMRQFNGDPMTNPGASSRGGYPGGWAPSPFPQYGRGNMPPPEGGAGQGPVPGGGGAPGGGPGGGGGPAGPYPATWNGLPPRAFDPSYLLRSMRSFFGSRGGAGTTYAPTLQDSNWKGNNQTAWKGIQLQGQPFNRT